MPPDLRSRLQDAAARPSRPVDVEALLSLGRRRRRRRRVLGGAGAALVAGVLALGVDAGLSRDGGVEIPDVVDRPDGHTVAPSASAVVGPVEFPVRDCPAGENPLYDPVDFLHWGGRLLVSTGFASPASLGGSSLTPEDLGDQVGVTQCAYAHVDQAAYGEPRDGDTAFRDPGTPLYALPGVDPTFRVVADTETSGLVVYDVFRADDATRGADVYASIADDVRRIEVMDWEFQQTLAVITTDTDVTSVVDDLLAGDFQPDAHPTGVGVAHRYRVRLHLGIGPPVDLSLYPEDHLVLPSLRVPRSFTEQVLTAVANRDA